MTVAAPHDVQLIPGYTTTERIGAGGYGEVWRAEAPGGFEKAIKVVYGFHDDERATRELKALERIKRVRHPFVLSVERAEIVDGRLAILTELADMSLDQRFEECRNNGQVAIGREELLGYLRDAADALDFLLQQHALQHLDIKPENLLLVAGHIKVADFGLIKHISERTEQSMVGGMTPTYAAPELFDGRPSPHSDQYSLAIVYQEMLTGALPFPGRTSAQLALQHTQGRPILAPLPEQDRDVIARALSKVPDERFKSCLEFVDALSGSRPRLRRGARADQADAPDAAEALGAADDTQAIASSATECLPRPQSPAVEQPQAADRHACTEAIRGAGDSVPVVVQSVAGKERLVLHVSTRVTEATVPVPSQACESFRPTLYVGLGGFGARVLAQLRHRLVVDGRADWSTVFPMLLLDTDRATIQAAQAGTLGGLLARDEACHFPLRRPQQYRAESPKLLNWLSRRWLYNIPRSLQTRGMRPLGRLALVDHRSRIVEALSEKLRAVVEPSGFEAAERASGLRCRSATPSVVLIASTDGGTGGGTAVDVAFALRSCIERLGVADCELLGMLSHATGRQQEQSELALANTSAMLSELFTVYRSGYRGTHTAEADAALFEGDEPPFNHLYFLHLGDDLADEGFSDKIGSIADYLYWTAVSEAGPTIELCREANAVVDTGTQQDVPLRSFSLTEVDLDEQSLTELEAGPLCPELMGHTRRRIVLVPQETQPQQIAALKRVWAGARTIPANVSDPLLLYEAERLSLAQADSRLFDARPDIVEVGQRLHVRNDIEWQRPPRACDDSGP